MSTPIMQLDERRRFTEAMLAGVSAGVIGLDPSARIARVNRRCDNLSGTSRAAHRQAHRRCDRALCLALRAGVAKPSGRGEGQVAIRVAGEERIFSVRVTTEESSEGIMAPCSLSTTLPNWCRRSATPPGPISPGDRPRDQESADAHPAFGRAAETQIHQGDLDRPQIFEQCTDTIIRQVGDIGRMVDEFSAFARMPRPRWRTRISRES